MAEQIRINDHITLDAGEIEISYIRSSGPGGQNVNKVATAAQIRFDLVNSPSLPIGLKTRARKLAGSKASKDGVIVITASSYRTQPQNKDDAISRLTDLLKAAAVVPKFRRKTQPTFASKKRRLTAKTQRGAIKSLRQSKPNLD